jgi:ubiquinone/menaquinone biosynthesis C-methylase UbiE
MELQVAIGLLKNGIETTSHPQRWADLGAGQGLFTVALSQTLTEGSTIVAVDKDVSALGQINIEKKGINLLTVHGDFTRTQLGQGKFDGILMANSLHFVHDKIGFINAIRTSLKPDGRILLIEYDMIHSNTWVPWPISFEEMKKLANQTGFMSLRKLGSYPSVYNRADIYSAVLSK